MGVRLGPDSQSLPPCPWQEQSNAPGDREAKRLFRVTHPFHPLHDRQFALLDYRNAWGENRVYFQDDQGELRRIPAAWTDVVGADPYVVVAQGRSPLRADDLSRLVELLRRLGERAGSGV